MQQIQFDGIQFIDSGKQELDCEYGRDWKIKKKNRKEFNNKVCLTGLYGTNPQQITFLRNRLAYHLYFYLKAVFTC